MKSSMAKAPAKDVDEYLAGVPDDARATLEKLRKTIRSTAPKAVEVIWYAIPTFKLEGRPLVGFGAYKNHCSFYPMSRRVMKEHTDELEDYDTSKGTIRFPTNKPLPVGLVKKLVKARIAENVARASRQ